METPATGAVRLVPEPPSLAAVHARELPQKDQLCGAFWGALIAYGLASAAALWVSMSPAAEWAGSDATRGLLGFWAMLLAPLVGGTLGALRAPLGRAPASRVRGSE